MKTYYTHAGRMHADEIMGSAICRIAGICDKAVRLKDISNIPDGGVVADIGRVYNPASLRFDHHQGTMRRSNHVPYATAGMIWKAFGKRCVMIAFKDEIREMDDQKAKEKLVSFVFDHIDEKVIQGIDAHDASNEFEVKAKDGFTHVDVITISNMVSIFNEEDINSEEQYDVFGKMSDIFVRILTKEMTNAYALYLSYSNLDDAIIFKQDGRVAIILWQSLRWKEVIPSMFPLVDFVISESQHPGNKYSMIAVPLNPKSRSIKCEIKRSPGFNGFIHEGKWIAGGNTVDELLELAEYSLKSKTLL